METTAIAAAIDADLPATTRLDTIILPERRFPWRLSHRRWERDLYVLRYQDASDPRQDEGPELLGVFPAEDDAFAFVDAGPIVPLMLELHRQRMTADAAGQSVVSSISEELPL